jgi:hypothetical protein
LFGDNGNSLAASIEPALSEVASAAQLGHALQSIVTTAQQENVVAAISGMTNLAGDLGASSDFVDTAQAVAGAIGTAASIGRAGQAALNAIDTGNIFGGVSSFAALAPEALGLFGHR